MGSLAKQIPRIRAEVKQIQDDYRLLSTPTKVANKAYAFNKDASYEGGGAYKIKDDLELQRANIQVTTDEADFFGTTYQDILSVERYKLPRVKSVEIVDRWRSSPMRFWQNMVNFAAWCATTGCGVSVEDHLNSQDPMLRSFYRFHAYYQIRRILEEIQAPLPQDDAWDAFDAS